MYPEDPPEAAFRFTAEAFAVHFAVNHTDEFERAPPPPLPARSVAQRRRCRARGAQ
jgi:hypothetical protein